MSFSCVCACECVCARARASACVRVLCYGFGFGLAVLARFMSVAMPCHPLASCVSYRSMRQVVACHVVHSLASWHHRFVFHCAAIKSLLPRATSDTQACADAPPVDRPERIRTDCRRGSLARASQSSRGPVRWSIRASLSFRCMWSEPGRAGFSRLRLQGRTPTSAASSSARRARARCFTCRSRIISTSLSEGRHANGHCLCRCQVTPRFRLCWLLSYGFKFWVTSLPMSYPHQAALAQRAGLAPTV